MVTNFTFPKIFRVLAVLAGLTSRTMGSVVNALTVKLGLRVIVPAEGG